MDFSYKIKTKDGQSIEGHIKHKIRGYSPFNVKNRTRLDVFKAFYDVNSLPFSKSKQFKSMYFDSYRNAIFVSEKDKIQLSQTDILSINETGNKSKVYDSRGKFVVLTENQMKLMLSGKPSTMKAFAVYDQVHGYAGYHYAFFSFNKAFNDLEKLKELYNEYRKESESEIIKKITKKEEMNDFNIFVKTHDHLLEKLVNLSSKNIVAIGERIE